jgi:flavin-binding protein dodecin
MRSDLFIGSPSLCTVLEAISPVALPVAASPQCLASRDRGWGSFIPVPEQRHQPRPRLWATTREEAIMAESVYKVIELVGTSEESWEKAASAAVAQAARSLRDLRIAEVSELDLQIEDGQVKAYRAKIKVSFKFEGD